MGSDGGTGHGPRAGWHGKADTGELSLLRTWAMWRVCSVTKPSKFFWPASSPSYESFHYWLIFKRTSCTCLWAQLVWWMSNTSKLVLQSLFSKWSFGISPIFSFIVLLLSILGVKIIVEVGIMTLAKRKTFGYCLQPMITMWPLNEKTSSYSISYHTVSEDSHCLISREWILSHSYGISKHLQKTQRIALKRGISECLHTVMYCIWSLVHTSVS